MAKAAQKSITPLRTAPSSRKSSSKPAADRPEKGDGPMKLPGCRWGMWSGVIGISETLTVFDGDDAVGDALDLPDSERVALADYMIALWSRFRFDGSAVEPAVDNSDGAVKARGDAYAAKYLELQDGIFSLCRAVAVVSSVVEDQLDDPVDAPGAGGHRPELQTFRIDAGTLRYAVDHAAELAVQVHRALI